MNLCVTAGGLFVAAVLLSACTSNQSAPTRPDRPLSELAGAVLVRPVAMVFADLDVDGDARLELFEIEKGMNALFADFDADGSASWSLVEFGDWAQLHLGDRYALPSAFQTDRNGDGSVTLEELVAVISEEYRRADTNRDGVLERSELLITLPTVQPRDPERMRQQMERQRRNRQERF